jgi:hypothetical protein
MQQSTESFIRHFSVRFPRFSLLTLCADGGYFVGLLPHEGFRQIDSEGFGIVRFVDFMAWFEQGGEVDKQRHQSDRKKMEKLAREFNAKVNKIESEQYAESEPHEKRKLSEKHEDAEPKHETKVEKPKASAEKDATRKWKKALGKLHKKSKTIEERKKLYTAARVSAEDLNKPKDRERIIENFEKRLAKGQQQSLAHLLTEEEKKEYKLKMLAHYERQLLSNPTIAAEYKRKQIEHYSSVQ